MFYVGQHLGFTRRLVVMREVLLTTPIEILADITLSRWVEKKGVGRNTSRAVRMIRLTDRFSDSVRCLTEYDGLCSERHCLR